MPIWAVTAWDWVVTNWRLILAGLAVLAVALFVWSWIARGDKIDELAATIEAQKDRIAVMEAEADMKAIVAKIDERIAGIESSRAEDRKREEAATKTIIAKIEEIPDALDTAVSKAVAIAIESLPD